MNTARLVLAVHVLVSFVFFGAAVNYLLAGEPIGAGLQAVIGAMVIGLGTVASRIVERR